VQVRRRVAQQQRAIAIEPGDLTVIVVSPTTARAARFGAMRSCQAG